MIQALRFAMVAHCSAWFTCVGVDGGLWKLLEASSTAQLFRVTASGVAMLAQHVIVSQT